MIDFHTHTLLSDGELLASEIVRRAQAAGYRAIGLTDHCDWSNIDFVVPHIAKAAEAINRHWDINVIPGAEITHVPLEEIDPLSRFARKHGAQLVIMHGETLSEPVLPGTNHAAIVCGVDILAHPGNITREDSALAAERGVYLEVTTRKNHSSPNAHVLKMARETGAKLLLNSDAHAAADLISKERAQRIISEAGLTPEESDSLSRNAEEFRSRLLF